MIALSEFVQAACSMIYLLNRKHMPYYKWMFRGMERLEKLKDMREPLEFLLTGEQDREGITLKRGVIEDVCASVIRELKKQGLSDSDADYLEPHAFSVTEHIETAQIRALHVMEG